MPIYTRTGDKGKTSLFSGKRVPKYSRRVEAYGTVDELNSVIGVVIGQMQKSKIKNQSASWRIKVKSELIKTQSDLLNIGSALASPRSLNEQARIKNLDKRVLEFEKFIDLMTEKISPLRNFILPGGGNAGAMLHFARSVSRRGERRIAELASKEEVNKNIIVYFNRLSDLLFTMARFVNFKEGKKEIIWSSKS